MKASVEGPFHDLALHADLHSKHATFNGLRSRDLVAMIDAPRIGPQMDLQAHVVLGELQVADETFSQLDLDLGWKTPELKLLAKTSNRGQPATISARLIVPANLKRADLEELRLFIAGGEWQLQLPAHLELENGVSFKYFLLTSGPQELRLSLEAAPDQLRLNAEVQNLDLARIPLIGLRGRKAAGKLTAAIQYQEGHRHRTAQAQAEVSELAMDRVRIPGATINASLNDSHLIAALDATLGTTDVKQSSVPKSGGKARLRFDGPLPTGPGPLGAQLEVSGVNAADFATFLPELEPFSGAITLDMALAGSWAAPQLQLNASADQLKGPWLDKPAIEVPPPVGSEAGKAAGPRAGSRVGPLSVELQLSTSEEFSKIHGRVVDDLKPNVDLIDLDGTFGIGSRQLAALLRSPGQIASQVSTATLKLAVKTDVVPLPAVGRIVRELSTMRGTAQLDAKVEGTPRAPRGSAQLTLRDFGFPHRHLGSIDLSAKAEQGGLSLQAKVQPPAQEGGQATVNASWGLRPEDLGNAGLRREAALRFSLMATDLPLALVLGRRSDLKGFGQATAEVHGSLGSPSGKAQLSLTSLQVLDKPAGSIEARAEWNGRILRAELSGDQPAGGKVQAQAELPLTMAGLGSGPLTGHLDATSFDLSTFEPVLVQTKAVRALEGILTADLSFGGTRAAPEPKGSLSLAHGKLALAGLGELQHIALLLHIDPNSLVVDRLEATSGGGPLTAHLSAVRNGHDELTVNGHLDTQRFGIYVDDQLRALLTSASDLSGKVTFPGPGADVTVSVRQASVEIPTLTQRDLAPTALDPEIHLLDWRGSEREASASEELTPEPQRPIYLRIAAPGPIDISGQDVQLTAHANLAARIASDVDLTGLVAVERGEVNALGRTFKIYRANVWFGEEHGDFAPPSSARLDVQAGQEIDGYRVTMVVLGRLDHPVPQLSSDPPLPQSQISQMLASGSSEGGVNPQGQAGGSSFASNLLVEGMKTWLKINPPVDVLTVDPNRLEAGKRITRHLYVGVTDNYAAVNDPRVNGTEVHARYDLGHHFALDGRYGTSQAGSFDLQWRHNW